jgi:periplasmic divalent cation tolerance protein
MISARNLYLVLVTTPNRTAARLLARAILEARLAACVNVVPGIESHYWWQSKLERSPELLLLIKTSKSKLNALENLVIRKHPYDTPEFIALPLGSGNRRYLEWFKGSLQLKQAPKGKG